MVKLFDLCYSECAWDSLSKWFIEQFYFSKTIAIMQKATANPLLFCGKETFVPASSIVFGSSSKTQWLSGLYYADFISFYSPTQLCGGGTTKSNSNELPISVPLSFVMFTRG
ncbi:hypothetical protein B7725_03460 [Streptococcus oralis subsp. tigurinus]|uniref:Uncharacterized protein n=1 Tax=Streptococcus oralis subsp. tigurinus TaxID=1077464 RepID=A0A1X1GNK5_STROR|nr:hypothetical protein B7725_03460 [Streptococcus oralis subsp. tigurinus]